jgi:hypothetical protein
LKSHNRENKKLRVKGLKGSKVRVFSEEEAATVKTVQRTRRRRRIADGEEEVS